LQKKLIVFNEISYSHCFVHSNPSINLIYAQENQLKNERFLEILFKNNCLSEYAKTIEKGELT